MTDIDKSKLFAKNSKKKFHLKLAWTQNSIKHAKFDGYLIYVPGKSQNKASIN